MMKKLFSLISLVSSVFFYAQKFDKLPIITEQVGNTYKIYIENNEFVQMSVLIEFKINNMTANIKNKEIVVVPAKTKKFPLLEFKIKDHKTPANYSFSTTYVYGNANQTNYDQDYIYDLPFKSGNTYSLVQGYNTTRSHKGQFALDFNLKTGEEINAAREGTVVFVEENFDKNCGEIICADFNNLILIQHSDGTFAEYLHLMYKGAEVEAGDIVSKGDLIGYSGNTGFSTGPHLHFAVYLNNMEGRFLYLKTKFKTGESAGEELIEKNKYYKNY